jgi:hypothetical protein
MPKTHRFGYAHHGELTVTFRPSNTIEVQTMVVQFDAAFTSLVDLLQWRAMDMPSRRLYTFLGESGGEESTVSCMSERAASRRCCRRWRPPETALSCSTRRGSIISLDSGAASTPQSSRSRPIHPIQIALMQLS